MVIWNSDAARRILMLRRHLCFDVVQRLVVQGLCRITEGRLLWRRCVMGVVVDVLPRTVAGGSRKAVEVAISG